MSTALTSIPLRSRCRDYRGGVLDCHRTASRGAAAGHHRLQRRCADLRTPCRKTPWGDPDLQGVWSSDDTSGIPRERPKELGNNLYQSDEAFAARVKQVEQGVKRGRERHRIVPQRLRPPRVRQTSLIVDPPDGTMPAVTAEAQKRRATRDRGTFGDGPFDTTEDFTLYDRCITRGIVGSVLRVVYGNGNRIVQAPGMVAIQLRDDSRHARHLHRRPPAHRPGHPAVPR